MFDVCVHETYLDVIYVTGEVVRLVAGFVDMSRNGFIVGNCYGGELPVCWLFCGYAVYDGGGFCGMGRCSYWFCRAWCACCKSPG